MAKIQRLDRCKQLYQQFRGMNPLELESYSGGFVDFDGPTPKECIEHLNFVFTTIDARLELDSWDDLPWHVYANLESQFQNLINVYGQLRSSKDQGNFQNFAQNLDSLVYHMRMFGVPHTATAIASIEKVRTALISELEQLTEVRKNAQQLRDDVKTLITPAVAGSLSLAFTARKNTLLWGRIAWGVVALALGIYCISATYDFAKAVGDAALTGTASTTKDFQGPNHLVWLSVLIRSVVLVPLYAAFGFSFAQYKKERDFEEEYAHKAAVATSLPNYGDLAREPSVRDQIVTGATNVIFLSPTYRSKESEKKENVAAGIKDILESVSKLIPKKD